MRRHRAYKKLLKSPDYCLSTSASSNPTLKVSRLFSSDLASPGHIFPMRSSPLASHAPIGPGLYAYGDISEASGAHLLDVDALSDPSRDSALPTPNPLEPPPVAPALAPVPKRTALQGIAPHLFPRCRHLRPPLPGASTPPADPDTARTAPSLSGVEEALRTATAQLAEIQALCAQMGVETDLIAEYQEYIATSDARVALLRRELEALSC
ncbi:hypothetical protein B0H17DRAFT_1204953 [Mycena rosella]|uniref:Uncharacterized protein n=1 Tax=Mycena rosella TaxID=1033263 RepID=A0AAD7D821_MYCRO|nr:hypothetical protein B0H17DRAFT_1204953 [Mycena rosella]